jgi:carboxyl-terminal processing protease
LEAEMLKGLLGAVPGEPNVFSASSLKVSEQLQGNRYVGIGIQLRITNGEKLPQITNLYGRGPAWRAGVKPSDLIEKIDGRDTRGVEMSKIVDWLRGEEGTDVTIVVRQPEEAEARTLTMTRSVVPFDTVLGYRRASGGGWRLRIDPSTAIGYVWVRAVNSSTLHELRQAERQLQAEGVRALVLDLRAPGGEGALHHAELVADGLLDGGLLWRLRGTGDRTQDFRADRDCLFRDWPLAVLVNGLVQSGPSIVAAALRDNDRAVLIGEPTIWNGLVRSMIPLPDGQASITLVTGRLERAAPGRGWPVQPDIPLSLDKPQSEAVRKWLSQKELPELPAGTDDAPPDDPQLQKAVELLRAALAKRDATEKPR